MEQFKKSALLCCLASLLLFGKIYAQNTIADTQEVKDTLYTPDHYQELKEQEIVVTASRSAQTIWSVPQKIEKIGRKDILLTPALDVTDLLKKSSSVQVIQYPGILSGIGIRGFRPQFSGLNQHTLLLINGRPAGTTNLGTLDLNFIDHVEILKGPASALYGSQAMGGVVNLLIPQTTGNIKGALSAEYGSFKTVQFGGHVGGNLTKKLDFDFGSSYFKRADIIRMGNGNLFRKMLGSSTALYRYSDKDVTVSDKRGDGSKRPNTKYAYFSNSGRIGYAFSSKWRLDLNGSLFNAYHVESPGDITVGEAGAGLKDINRYSTELGVTGRIGVNLLTLRGYYSKEKSTAYTVRNAKGMAIDSPYLSSKNSYKWYGSQLRDQIDLGKQKIIVGYDFNHAQSENTAFYAPINGVQHAYATAPNSAIITNGVYIQGLLQFLKGSLLINPGMRLDITDFKIYETPGYTKVLHTGHSSNHFSSPSLSLQWNILSGLAVHGSIGRAFITPDASQVAGIQIGGKGSGKIAILQGNPNLKNESSVSEDFGVKFNNRASYFDVTYFNTNVRNRIASISAPPAIADTIDGDAVTAVTNYYNANKSSIRGLELIASYDLGSLQNYRYLLRVFANATFTTKAEDITVNKNGSQTLTAIQNVAKMVMNYGLEFGKDKWSARLTCRYMGRRWDTDYNDSKRPLVYYPSFMTADAVVCWQFVSHHQISLSATNITDENYYEKRGFNMPGRSISLKYAFQFGK